MTPPLARELMHRYGIRPKRSLAQNFLVDDAYLARIAGAAELTPQDTVLEIGPGLGVLTHHLAAQAGRVVAVELDGRMINVLREQFPEEGNVRVVRGDILALDPVDLLSVGPWDGQPCAYKVVANLPYYISSAVLRHLLESPVPPRLLVVLMQKEVAHRICAQPGELSLLAVSVQLYARPHLVAPVPAAAFVPRPNVDSAILRLEVLPEAAVTDIGKDDFFRVVRAGFGQKRKQLANSLSGGLHMSKDDVQQALHRAGIDGTRRAQTLSLAEWGRLSRALIA